MKRSLFIGVLMLGVVLVMPVGTWAADYSMRTAEIFREGFTHSESQKFFAKRVGEITKGRAEVKVFLAAVLGNERNY